MQYRILDRQTLAFVDGGFVAEYTLRLDYIVMPNSIIRILKPTEGRVGDVIALIETAGAYITGCITAIDEAEKTIYFKDLKELFNGNQLNPLRYQYIEDDVFEVRYDVIQDTAKLLLWLFTDINKTLDPLALLPISVVAGGSLRGVWKWDGNDFNVLDLLLDIFDKHNVVLHFDLVVRDVKRIVVTVYQNTVSDEVIRDNIKLLDVKIKRDKQPDKTVCKIIYNKLEDKDGKYANGKYRSRNNKDVLSTWYLRDGDLITANPVLTERVNGKDCTRILPPCLVTTEIDDEMEANGITDEHLAFEELGGQIYNHCVSAEIDKYTNLINLSRLQTGDAVKIITKNGEIDTIFTGYETNDKSIKMTLTFGKSRVDYTDITQITLRRLRSGRGI